MRPSTETNLDGSAAVDQNGVTIPADFVLAISAQAVVTGTSTGTLNIQASNDTSPLINNISNPDPTNWSDIATLGTVSISGAGVYLIPKFDVAYKWLRASFTADNGASGTISVNVHTFGF